MFAVASFHGSIRSRRNSEALFGDRSRLSPSILFPITEANTEESSGAKRITSIDIHSAKKLVQTIRFEDDEDAPIDFAPGNLVTLKDVACDGYKDLLVRNLVGVHGDAWHHLYRFDPAKRQFVEYAPFIELAYKGVDCRTKVVKTYVNSGAAGCIYEAGWYQRVNGELFPVRIESQDEDDNSSFLRTIRVWRNGKAIVLSTNSIPADDCHEPNKPMGKQKKRCVFCAVSFELRSYHRQLVKYQLINRPACLRHGPCFRCPEASTRSITVRWSTYPTPAGNVCLNTGNSTQLMQQILILRVRVLGEKDPRKSASVRRSAWA
ncbi:MAG: hypothetical protein ABSG62_06045 [Terracidiphilus sp.]|jgi:hypothetical protein